MQPKSGHSQQDVKKTKKKKSKKEKDRKSGEIESVNEVIVTTENTISESPVKLIEMNPESDLKSVK